MNGFTWTIKPEDKTYLPVSEGKHYKPWLTALFGRVVQPGDTVIDVGAFYGFHTLALARFVGDAGMVCAFEPHMKNANLLRDHLNMNKVDNVRVFEVGLAHREMVTCICNAVQDDSPNLGDSFISRHYQRHGKEDIRIKDYIGKAGIALPLTKSIVRCIPLDSVPMFSTVSLVNIEVQGFEKMVVEGGLEILRRHRPIITVELENPCMMLYGYESGDFFDMIHDLEYTVYLLDSSYPSDHVCVPNEKVTWFETMLDGCITENTVNNETNYNLQHGVAQRIAIYEETDSE